MRVQLKEDLKLERREGVIGQGGFHQNFVRVLVIVMLIDEKLYLAADVAATAWDSVKEKLLYRYHKQGFYKWANQPNKNISGSPDNIDPETGKKRKRQWAMWFGKTWKSCVSDVVWNMAVDIFDEVRLMHQADLAAGLIGVTYWWNEEGNKIDRDVPEQLAPTIEPAEEPEPEADDSEAESEPKKRHRVWLPVAAVAATFLMSVLLTVPFRTNGAPVTSVKKPDQMIFLGELSIREALRQTKTGTKELATSNFPLTSRWEKYATNWDSRPFTPTKTYTKNANPKLFLDPQIVLANLP